MSGQMKQVLAASTIAVIVALAIGLGVYFIQPQLMSSKPTATTTNATLNSFSTTSNTVINTTTESPMDPCITQYSPSLNSSQVSTTVVLSTNSSAKLCVTIYNNNNLNNNITATWSGPPAISVLRNGSWSQDVENLTVSIHPNIHVVPNSNGTFQFTITPLTGTHAIYQIDLPQPCWTIDSYWFVLAVGMSMSQILALRNLILNADSGIYTGCSGLEYIHTNITGYTNLNPVFLA